RHAKRVIVEVLLAKQPMLPNRETLVRGKDDDGVRRASAGLQSLQNAPNLGIQVTDDRVILPEMNADSLLGARVRRQNLVTPLEIRFDQERMSRQEIRRHLELLRRVEVQK